MNFLANLLSGTASKLANTGSQASVGWIWEEPVCPEEIL
ncbi:MAG: cyclic lactone autoinducer peptide [Bacilli bacterium]|jgi:cyclic lactone autoinducer peptide|nr:cyclic lactone autoinducer peptide [Bacilli bacterium]